MHPHGTMKRGSVHIMPMEPMSMRGAVCAVQPGKALMGEAVNQSVISTSAKSSTTCSS